MSFSAANMCRFVIAVVFISFVSSVLTEAVTPDSTKNRTEKCFLKPQVNESNVNLTICFNEIVARHLNTSIESKSGECQNATDFGKKLDNHYITMAKYCNSSILDTTDFIKLVDFSLRNDSFKKFYADISCVKSFEANISNTCVKGIVGFFNITKERQHTKWYRKANLHYNLETCNTTVQVKNCVETILEPCQNESREYVTSLYNFERELADCAYLEKMASTTPSPGGKVPVQARSVMTKPVIITLSIGGVVVLIAIIIIIVLKYKHLKD